MIDAVSSPSNLGTRGGVSTGTPVDPWMVRPINGTVGQVICLDRSVLREFELQSEKNEGDTRCRIEYPRYKLRDQKPVPPNMHHVANGGRAWA
jgi:hypothetical protein